MRALSNTTYDQLVHFNAESLWAWSLGGATGAVEACFSQYRPLLISQIYTQQTLHPLRASGWPLLAVFLGKLIARAGFRARTATAFSIMIESMIIFELSPLERGAAATVCGPSRLPRRLRRRIGPMDATSPERVARGAIRLPLGRIETMVA
jgi:hypothetical protein